MISNYMINGELVPVKEAQISVLDLGLLRGYGIFDFFPFENSRLVFIQDYLDRFFASATKMQLEPPDDRQALLANIMKVIRSNGQPNGYIRLVLTGGDSADGYSPVVNNLYILQYDPIYYDSAMYDKGVKLTLQRFNRERPDVKTLNYANPLRHRDLIREVGAMDVLYHDGRCVHETSRANFFMVDSKQRIHSSPNTVLQGITRLHVLKVASRHYEIINSPVELSAVVYAHEAFITSTTKGVLSVTQIDDLIIGKGKPGPVTGKIADMFQDYLRNHLETESLAPMA